jgi:glycosyltransferase involved in cell wall biosynthesis
MTAPVTDKLIVVSQPGRELGLREGVGSSKQYEVVYSGIDVASFSLNGNHRAAARRSLGFGDEHIVVGTVSCLKPQKAPLDFVRAAAEAHSRDDRLRFILVGDGELAPQTQALVEELGLTGIVKLLGWRRDVVDLLHAMDLFLLTSLFEGLPRAVLQAMAAGVPVIATAVDGTPEVVRDRETGLLVPPARPLEAARGVLEFVEDADLRRRCVRQARQVLGRGFDVNRMVADLDRLYLALLEGA